MLLCSRHLYVNSWEFVYARLSVFYSQDCGEFPGICRSRDWMYRTDENQRIPGNLNENYQELLIPKTEL